MLSVTYKLIDKWVCHIYFCTKSTLSWDLKQEL